MFGKDIESHNRALLAVVKRLAQHNLTLNKSKCELNKTELRFYGCKFSEHGISVDSQRVEMLNKMPPPTNAADAVSMLRMFGFCLRHISDNSSLVEPIHHLTKSGTVCKVDFDVQINVLIWSNELLTR